MKKKLLLSSRWLVSSSLFLFFILGSTVLPAATINVPGDQPTIQAAISAASLNDVILVAPATYVIPSGTTITVNKSVTIDGGSSSTTKIQTSGTSYLFLVTAANAAIKNFEIEKTDNGSVQNIIGIQASNFELATCFIHGTFTIGDAQTTRAIETSGGLTGINIHDNTFRKLRQPGYLNGSTGVIANNLTEITKGWVVVPNSNYTFTNNTWGTGVNVNYYDIAIIGGAPNNYPDIVAISANNNDATIENQTYSPAILSIVRVNSSSVAPGNGSVLEQYPTISQAVPRVAPGGKVLIASGTYNEQVNINKGARYLGVGLTQPIVNFTGSPAGKPTLFDISQPDVTIQNINFKVDLTKLSSAIIASGTNISNLTIKDNVIEPIATSNAGSFDGYGNRNAVSINYGGSINYRVAAGGVNNILVDNNVVTATANDGYGVARAFRSAISVDEGGGTFTNNTLQSINHDVLVRFGSNGPITISNNHLNGGGVELAEMNAGAGTLTVSDNIFDGTFANTSAPNTAVLRLRNNQVNVYTNVANNKFNNAEWGISSENYKNLLIQNNEFTPLANSTVFHHIAVNTKSISSNSSLIVQTQIFARIINNKFFGSALAGGTAIGFYNHDADAASYGVFDVHENSFDLNIGNDIYIDNQTGNSSTSVFPDYISLLGTGGTKETTMAAWTAPVLASCNWYGTTDYKTVSSKVGNNVSFAPYLNNGTDNDVATGFQPVPNSCTGPTSSISFKATSSNGAASTSDGNPVKIKVCSGGSFNYSNYSSSPSIHVGVLDDLVSSGNVTYNSGAVPSTRPQIDFGVSGTPSYFKGGPYGPYGLSSGSSGTIDETFTPYYDADNSGTYTTGDVLGTPVTLHFDILANQTWYRDADGDGFGDPNNFVQSCTGQPAGYVADHSDCNDNLITYQDLDHDGFGSNVKVPCGGVTNNYDANDNDGKADIYVCHKGITITINASAFKAHLSHGDQPGQCPTSQPITQAAPLDMTQVLLSVSKLAVYPNPSFGQFTLQLNNLKASKAQIVLMDQNGRTIEQRSIQLINGQQSVIYSTRKFASGMYIVKVISEDGVQTSKVMIH
jgi:hypothetical protein